MNSIWNKNIEQFSKRFPSLAQNLNLSSMTEPDFDFWQVMPAKSGDLTAKENGVSIHSAYNPVRDAQNTVSSTRTENIWGAAFFSMGLGYAPLEWAKKHKEDTIIIVEPVPDYFFAALKYVDLTELFNHQKLILALQAGIEAVTGLIEQSAGFNHIALIENKSQSAHSSDYFISLRSLIERNKKKVQINNWTLEKFSKLWLNNSCRNIRLTAELDGVNLYQNKCPENLPAILVSAGPTLSEILPHLKELKKRAIIIAVDTALKACLSAGVEPDFIVLVDPQYYAWRHIAGLKSESSVLITESAAYPSAFRFKCRKTVLCSSLFPMGQYFEKKLGSKGRLGAGGSVSTTAWDFARLTGAKTIYCAGLDLGYPKLQSHIRGSLFEEKTHRTSRRNKTSEKELSCSLFASGSIKDKDYSGQPITTDDKMKMFAWWFESKAQEYPQIKSFSLSKESLSIPGFQYCGVEALLCLPDKSDLRQEFFNCEKNHGAATDTEAFKQVLNQLISGFEELYSLAKKGIKIADEAISSPENSVKISTALSQLEQIDSLILHSQFTEAASLVFPTESKLNKIFDTVSFPSDSAKALLTRSKIIYRELMNSIRQYQKYF